MLLNLLIQQQQQQQFVENTAFGLKTELKGGSQSPIIKVYALSFEIFLIKTHLELILNCHVLFWRPVIFLIFDTQRIK